MLELYTPRSKDSLPAPIPDRQNPDTMTLSEPVRAALIGATVTIVVSLIQLTVNARRQAVERAAGKPASKKTGNWLATFALMLASAVAGYAFSEYQAFKNRADDRMLRDELHSRLKDIGAMAVRIEKANLETAPQSEAEIRLAVERKRGLEGVLAVVNVPACRASQAGVAASPAGCGESEALRTAVCAVVPPAAVVTEVQIFIRAEDATGPWSGAKVESGQDGGGARFVDSYFERARDAEGKEICMNLVHWAADKGRSARILVRYML